MSKEAKFRKYFREKYFEYKDSGYDVKYLIACEEIASKVFGWTEQRLEKYETRLLREWRKENE